MTMKYNETKGSAYNYEVGYLEGLRKATRTMQMNLDNTEQNRAMYNTLINLIREQKELIEEEFPEVFLEE